ncbi:helix-turn-helix domain-containing protein [Larkinella soli]|uniref:helix-turn-helix domain-containing protein n=1 Tax=Larkinella soli TaxID=1770527 RepID=UPI000FFC78F9|nr:helix-turn-helix domain-containing protein [Larkinella soli]
MSIFGNEKLRLANDFILHTNRNVFLTGKAGTGKTTFLQSVKQISSKRMAVVAPTGVAAINAGGVTIHSLFQLPFGPLTPGFLNRESRKFNREKISLLRTLDLLIIDEISMVRADVLDGIDEVLRRYRNHTEPFGGVQLLMIGDMQQLPPVIRDEEWALLEPYYETGYFFGSKALQKTPYVSIELTQIYRQSDERFIAILNSIREKKVTRAQLDELNRRHIPDFSPSDKEGYITLSTHNQAAQQINSQKLEALKAPVKTFEARIEGDFPAHAYPTEATLELKIGAQVMFIKNDISIEKAYFNGKIGQISDIHEETIFVRSASDGEEIAVTPVEWSNIRYSLDPATKEITAETIGKFIQYPLKLAWAITIHKSQGLTFEKAIIDASAAFAHGQVYVALSRCKSLEGMVLRAPIPSHSIKTEATLEVFHDEVQRQIPTLTDLWEGKRANQEKLLNELFSFERADGLLSRCRKIVGEHLGSFPEETGPALENLGRILDEKARQVGNRFRGQFPRYFSADRLPEEIGPLQERICKASDYFRAFLSEELLPPLQNLPTDCDNRKVRESMVEALDELEKELSAKLECFEVTRKGFVALAYLKARNLAELNFQSSRQKALRLKPSDPSPSGGSPGRKLYTALTRWRDNLAGEHDVAGYLVLSRKTILELVETLPTTREELLNVKGFGKTKVKQIGDEVLALIRAHCEEHQVVREPPAPEIRKDKKTASSAVSLAMFREGKTIRDISAGRGISVATVEGHLAQHISLGDLDVEDVLPTDKVETIRAYLETHQDQTLTETKMALGDSVSYTDIRMVFNSMRRETAGDPD